MWTTSLPAFFFLSMIVFRLLVVDIRKLVTRERLDTESADGSLKAETAPAPGGDDGLGQANRLIADLVVELKRLRAQNTILSEDRH